MTIRLCAPVAIAASVTIGVAFGAPERLVPAGESPTKADATIDLLKQIDLKQHVRAGKWRIDGGSLVSPEDRLAKMILPCDVPETYRLLIVAQRTSGKGALGVLLPIGGRSTSALFEGYEKMVSGLNLVDGRTVDRNRTAYWQPVFAPGKATTIEVNVARSRILVVCDGKVVVNWQGDAERLSVHPNAWPAPPANRLGLASWGSSFRISRIELAPTTSEAGRPTGPSVPPREVAKLGQSVVLIEHPSGKGSGFIVAENLVATNSHVIRGTFPEEVKVLFPRGKSLAGGCAARRLGKRRPGPCLAGAVDEIDAAASGSQTRVSPGRDGDAHRQSVGHFGHRGPQYGEPGPVGRPGANRQT